MKNKKIIPNKIAVFANKKTDIPNKPTHRHSFLERHTPCYETI